MAFEPIQSQWMSPAEAAAYLGCSRNFLDKDRITGLLGIPFSKLGRHIRYSREALDAYLKSTAQVTDMEECHG